MPVLMTGIGHGHRLGGGLNPAETEPNSARVNPRLISSAKARLIAAILLAEPFGCGTSTPNRPELRV